MSTTHVPAPRIDSAQAVTEALDLMNLCQELMFEGALDTVESHPSLRAFEEGREVTATDLHLSLNGRADTDAFIQALNAARAYMSIAVAS